MGFTDKGNLAVQELTFVAFNSFLHQIETFSKLVFLINPVSSVAKVTVSLCLPGLFSEFEEICRVARELK